MGNMKTLRKARNLPHKSPWPEPMNHFFFSSPTSLSFLLLLFFSASCSLSPSPKICNVSLSHGLCVREWRRRRGEMRRRKRERKEKKGEHRERERERERERDEVVWCAGNVRR